MNSGDEQDENENEKDEKKNRMKSDFSPTGQVDPNMMHRGGVMPHMAQPGMMGPPHHDPRHPYGAYPAPPMHQGQHPYYDHRQQGGQHAARPAYGYAPPYMPPPYPPYHDGTGQM